MPIDKDFYKEDIISDLEDLVRDAKFLKEIAKRTIADCTEQDKESLSDVDNMLHDIVDDLTGVLSKKQEEYKYSLPVEYDRVPYGETFCKIPVSLHG